MSHPDPRVRLRVAAARVESVPGDVGGNARTAAAALAVAADRGAELTVFGELSLPGYHPPTLADPDTDVDLADARLDAVRDATRRTGTAALLGASVRHGADRFIATLLVDSRGEVREVYRKQNLCGPHERRLFTPGTHGATLRYRGWRLGLGICYDASFPEHARAAALDGCHAYISGGAFVVGGEHRRDTYHSARALDNTCYVVFADAVGGPAPWTFGGGSQIYDPEGRAVGRTETAELVVADLDPRSLHHTRRDHTMLADLVTRPAPRQFAEM